MFICPLCSLFLEVPRSSYSLWHIFKLCQDCIVCRNSLDSNSLLVAHIGVSPASLWLFFKVWIEMLTSNASNVIKCISLHLYGFIFCLKKRKEKLFYLKILKTFSYSLLNALKFAFEFYVYCAGRDIVGSHKNSLLIF